MCIKGLKSKALFLLVDLRKNLFLNSSSFYRLLAFLWLAVKNITPTSAPTVTFPLSVYFPLSFIRTSCDDVEATQKIQIISPISEFLIISVDTLLHIFKVSVD
jgi:hypothetical protein